MNKVIKIIGDIVFVTIIVLLLAYMFLSFTNKVEIYNVKTGSMEDSIHIGDYILIYKKSNYNIGDVITYKKDDGFVTHRIISKNEKTLVTKGDANNVEDEEISYDIIVGKVIMIGGLLNIVIKYKYALICLFIALYLISCYLDKNKKIV